MNAESPIGAARDGGAKKVGCICPAKTDPPGVEAENGVELEVAVPRPKGASMGWSGSLTEFCCPNCAIVGGGKMKGRGSCGWA